MRFIVLGAGWLLWLGLDGVLVDEPLDIWIVRQGIGYFLLVIIMEGVRGMMPNRIY
jgi:hypothetical protein